VTDRHADWLAQARRDLDAARVLTREGLCEVACFHAQQAAEKALKAIYLVLGEEAWGHSVEGLMRNLPESRRPTEGLLTEGERLDRHYVPARYPNGWLHGAPKDHYAKDDADAAIRGAEAILAWCDGLLARP
jgi:HEPN domain-containing protein